MIYNQLNKKVNSEAAQGALAGSVSRLTLLDGFGG
jgi:hypothetical protein